MQPSIGPARPPQLPPLIALDPGDACDDESFSEALLTWSGEQASLIGADITDSRLARLPSDHLHARRLRLAEVEVTDPSVVTLNAPRSHWRLSVRSPRPRRVVFWC